MIEVARLGRIQRAAEELGAAAIAEEARSLAERAAEGRFYVACVGQFKRGKSTLLNALVGAQVLPTGTAPVTSVVTVLRHGDEARARMRRAGEGWEPIAIADLADIVSEERNPGNVKGVLAVEVFTPSPLLASGLCFVDTPGLGSVFEANSEATREFVPHIDAALAVFGADPPLSGEEMGVIEEIARNVESFVFVLNKADRVTPVELEEATAFARRVLAERMRLAEPEVFRVSALEVLRGEAASRDWPALLQRLRELAEESGQVLVRGAVERGVARLTARLANVLREERAALERPLEETRERVRVLHRASEEAARALWELGPLFDAEMRRLGDAFRDRRVAFLREAMPKVREGLAEYVARAPVRFGPALRAHALHEALRLAQETVLPWLRQSETEASRAYRESAERFAGHINGLLERLRGSDAWRGIPLPDSVDLATGADEQSRFRFETFAHLESPAGLVAALDWLADALLPRAWTRRRIEPAVRAYLERLMEANAHRVENGIKQRLQDSRLRLESQIRYALQEVIQAAERGLERALALQDEGAEAVRAAVERIDEVERRLLEGLEEAPLAVRSSSIRP